MDTPGKRSPVWSDGTQLLEWEFNRAVGAAFARYLTAAGISNVRIVDGDKDLPLRERSDRILSLYEQHKERYYVYGVSLHGNASEHASAHGVEAFTSVGVDDSDYLCDVYLRELAKLGWRMRYDKTDGFLDKELDFWILRNTKPCPMLLTETGFYTNETECRRMMDRFWRNRIALLHLNAAAYIETKGINHLKREA